MGPRSITILKAAILLTAVAFVAQPAAGWAAERFQQVLVANTADSPVPVSVQGTPAVEVSGTPTVKLDPTGNTISLASGATVDLVSDAGVTVENGSANPVPVTETSARQPFSLTLNTPIGQDKSFSEGGDFIVPGTEGWLVLKTISFRGLLEPGVRPMRIGITYPQTHGGAAPTRIWLTGVESVEVSGLVEWTATNDVELVIPAGSSFHVEWGRTVRSWGTQGSFSLAGYLTTKL